MRKQSTRPGCLVSVFFFELPRELWTLRSKVGYKDLAKQYGSDLVVILESPNVDSRLVQSARDNPLKNKIQFV